MLLLLHNLGLLVLRDDYDGAIALNYICKFIIFKKESSQTTVKVFTRHGWFTAYIESLCYDPFSLQCHRWIDFLRCCRLRIPEGPCSSGNDEQRLTLHVGLDSRQRLWVPHLAQRKSSERWPIDVSELMRSRDWRHSALTRSPNDSWRRPSGGLLTRSISAGGERH